jgi:phage terminase large subunit-like protein
MVPTWSTKPRRTNWLRNLSRIVRSRDTACKATELSDFSVCTSWGISGKDLYLIDVLRRRMEYPELKRAVRAEYERWRSGVVLIEDKASGTQVIQELIADGLYAVARYSRNRTRSRASTPDRDDRKRLCPRPPDRPPGSPRTSMR